MGFILDDAHLINTASLAVDANGQPFHYIVPGDPEDSFIYIRVAAGLQADRPRLGMPPASITQRPTYSDLSVLHAWIDCLGPAPSPAPDASSPPPPVGPGDGSSGLPGADGSLSLDASLPVDATPPLNFDAAPPPGEAGFGFVVGGILQAPMSCPSDNWEYNPVDASGQPICTLCRGADGGRVAVPAAVVNTEQFPLAYYATSAWTGTGYVPGILTGAPGELVGVLAPGDQVDITSVFGGGIVALLGSAAPFSDGSKYESDEGTIPWPAGVAGSGGASQMHLAEIELKPNGCAQASQIW